MYSIKKTADRITSLGDAAWNDAEIAEIKHENWLKCSEKINTTGRLLYSDYGIHIRMETDEKPLLARQTAQNSDVYRDSCMELFIRPNESDKRYLNFEFNPFGTMYLAIRTSSYDGEHPQKNREYFEVKSCVNEEKWVLQFTIPFEFIDEAFGTYTDTMYANLFKCGDETPHEHYISYSPVNSEVMDFHQSEFFAKFILE